MKTLWEKIPLLIRAVLIGVALSALGTLPWAILVKINMTYGKVVPWAIVPTAAYLWLFWRWVTGTGWPESLSAARRENVRANTVSSDQWGLALFAGMLGLGATLSLQNILGRFAALPQQKADDLSQIPGITLLLMIVMGAVVAGVVEESSFRGYMQRMIEKRHGIVQAILVSGIVFGLAHFTHPEVGFVLLPYYMMVAAVYGLMAYFTDSIYPSMLLHTAGNIFGSLDLLFTGKSEWQTTTAPPPLIWQTGPDRDFWMSCGVLMLLSVGGIWSFIALAKARSNMSSAVVTE